MESNVPPWKPVKIVIIESKTRRFLSTEQLEYTRVFKDALDFPDVRAAKEFCKTRNLEGHTIVAKCDRLCIESFLHQV